MHVGRPHVSFEHALGGCGFGIQLGEKRIGNTHDDTPDLKMSGVK